jgi:hypothetical protein
MTRDDARKELVEALTLLYALQQQAADGAFGRARSRALAEAIEAARVYESSPKE